MKSHSKISISVFATNTLVFYFLRVSYHKNLESKFVIDEFYCV